MNFDITYFEKKYNLEIPEDYKCILKLIDLSILSLEYYDPKEDFFFRLVKWINYLNNSGLDIKIDSFFKRNSLLKIWERHIELWGFPVNFLPIASTTIPANGLILLALGASDYGEIWYSKHGSRETEYLEKNISLFINSLSQVLREDKLEEVDKLYINKSEDFWRIR